MLPRQILLLSLAALLLGGCPGQNPLAHQERGPLAKDQRLVLIDGRPVDSRPLPSLGDLSRTDRTPPDLPRPDSWTSAGDIGKPCLSHADCQYKVCVLNQHTGVTFCSKICNPCAPPPCPTGSGCQDAGTAYICAPGYPNTACP